MGWIPPCKFWRKIISKGTTSCKIHNSLSRSKFPVPFRLSRVPEAATNITAHQHLALSLPPTSFGSLLTFLPRYFAFAVARRSPLGLLLSSSDEVCLRFLLWPRKVPSLLVPNPLQRFLGILESAGSRVARRRMGSESKRTASRHITEPETVTYRCLPHGPLSSRQSFMDQ
jgi:hypothetical protein